MRTLLTTTKPFASDRGCFFFLSAVGTSILVDMEASINFQYGYTFSVRSIPIMMALEFSYLINFTKRKNTFLLIIFGPFQAFPPPNHVSQYVLSSF